MFQNKLNSRAFWAYLRLKLNSGLGRVRAELLGPFTTLFENPKGPGNPNTCAEVNQCLFLFKPALEIVCRETEVFKQLVLANYERILSKTSL